MSSFLYSVAWGSPLPTEYDSNAAYTNAIRTTLPRRHVLLRRYLPSQRPNDPISRYSYTETNSWRAEYVAGPAVTPCICCGEVVHSHAVNALGFSVHQRCLNGAVLPRYAEAAAETFELMADPLVYRRSWAEVLPTLRRRGET